MAGKALESIPTLSMAEFCDLMKSETPGFPLDIRSEEEIKGDGFKNGVQIHLTQLLDHLDAVPRDSKILPLCTSGYRSMLAASLLKKEGWEDVALPIGGLAAWQAFGCDFEL
jgi:hydroxyacylglutathione hydrolase